MVAILSSTFFVLDFFASSRLCVRFLLHWRRAILTENAIAKIVVDVAYHIHVKLGPGLLESVYQAVMVHELGKRGLSVADEVDVPVEWDGVFLETGFRADVIVERKVVLELKSVERVAPVHKMQLLTYLRLTTCRLGLLINFGESLIKDGITRVVNGLRDEGE